MSQILTYTIPSVRRVGVGTALMLERPATPGWRGALSDLLRTLMGEAVLCGCLHMWGGS